MRRTYVAFVSGFLHATRCLQGSSTWSSFRSTSSLSMANTPLDGQTAVRLPIHAGARLGWVGASAVVNGAAVNSLADLDFILLGTFSGAELLGCVRSS